MEKNTDISSSEKKKKVDDSELKESILGYRGGIRLNLKRIMSSGKTLEQELSEFITDIMRIELKNREAFINKIPHWERLYKCTPEKKTWPWDGCFSRDTELLTDKGWISVENLKPGQKFLSLDVKTGQCSYRPATAIVKHFYEKIFDIKSKAIDLSVTHDHNVLVETQNGITKFVHPAQLKNGQNFILNAKWRGIKPEKLFGLNPLDCLEFVGWYLAEGWMTKWGTIGISQSKDIKKRANIRELLKRLGFKFSENKYGFVISKKSIPHKLFKLLKSTGKAWERFIPRQFLNFDQDYLFALLNGLIAGDGNIHFKKDGLAKISYYTTSKRLADDVQEIALKIGLHAVIHKDEEVVGRKIIGNLNFGIQRRPEYLVNFLWKERAKVGACSIEERNYFDYAYCPVVPPFHTVYARRNGKALWVGQCANVARPLIRTATDTIFVRNMDNLFNKQKVWIITAKKEEYAELAKNIEDALDWFQANILNLRQKLHSPLLQAFKIGTGYTKWVYEEKKKVIYRYATDDDEKRGLPTYQIPGSKSKAVKSIKTIYRGPNLYPISREDWIQSSDAVDFQESILCGHRFYLRPNRVRLKQRQGLFFDDAVSRLLGPSKQAAPVEGKLDDVKKERAELEYKQSEFIDVTKPIPFWELYVKYDVDEDGEEDDIIVTIHYESGIIMDAMYNPLFGNFRPFRKWIFYPVEFSQDGEGTCQILEAINEEINTLGNQRIDRVTQINCPVLFVREGSGLAGLKRITPGKVYVVDEDLENAIREFRFSDVTVSSEREEERLIAMGKEAVGLTPAVQGLPSADRPVAKVEWSQLEEANKKFKYGQDNIREQLRQAAFDILEFMAQYQPTFTYYINDEKGFPVEKTIEFPTEDIREILEIRLATASEIMNQQIRQQIGITLYQMISDYMTKVGGMAQALTSPQVPSEFKKVLLEAANISAKVMKRIIDDYPTVPDADSVVLDLFKVIDVEKALMQSADIIQQQQQMQQALVPGVQPGGQEEQPLPGYQPGQAPNEIQ